MTEQNNQQGKTSLFGFTVENAKEILSRHSREEIDKILADAKEAGKQIQSREAMYAQRVPDEILKKPFEIVK